MRFGPGVAVRFAALLVLLGILALGHTPDAWAASDRPAESGQAVLEAFPPACSVELDSIVQGKTGSQGGLSLAEVEAGDHYLHVDCPGQAEQEFFISLKPGGRVDLKPKPPADPPSALDAAKTREQLRDLVRHAVDERGAGHSEQAIAGLRQAAELDPANADLHRELGITFLLLKDWKRARVEYLEAIKHDPSEAESHNGLGYALEKLGGIGAAAGQYGIAMRLDPDDGEYREHYFKALAMVEAEKDKAKKK
jgi:tetratricopeptide (TPR) repeat protein